MPLPIFPPAPPAPSRFTDDEDTFPPKMDAMLAYIEQLPPEIANFVLGLAGMVTTANYSATSTSAVTVGTGARSFVTETGKMFVAGGVVIIADAAAPTTNWLYAQIVSYNIATGDLAVNVLRSWGAGTKAAWTIGLTGLQGIGSDTLPSFSGNAGRFLGVNPAADGTLWMRPTWTLIGTLTPAAAANATFSSLKSTGYRDLQIILDLTFSTSTGVAMAVSPDGSNFGVSAVVGASGTVGRGGMWLPGANANVGMALLCIGSTTSPSAAIGVNSNVSWSCTGGVDAIRFAPQSGTMSGTLTLFGIN